MSSTHLTRLVPALALVSLIVIGAVVGGAVLAGATSEATPMPTPTTIASPTSAALPGADVPGDDLARLPRYPGSVRTEFRVERDDRYRLTAVEYVADATVDAVRTFYRGVMEDHGWQRADVGYAGGEWTYVLVDGGVEALVEIELARGLVEIDVQVSEPLASPDPTPTPTPAPTARPAAPATVQPVIPPGDDDGDDDDDDGSDDADSDD